MLWARDQKRFRLSPSAIVILGPASAAIPTICALIEAMPDLALGMELFVSVVIFKASPIQYSSSH